MSNPETKGERIERLRVELMSKTDPQEILCIVLEMRMYYLQNLYTYDTCLKSFEAFAASPGLPDNVRQALDTLIGFITGLKIPYLNNIDICDAGIEMFFSKQSKEEVTETWKEFFARLKAEASNDN